MTDSLKSLEEHNAKMKAIYHPPMSAPRLNGIACPECGEELYDTNSLFVLAVWPPKYEIHCASCGYKGSRL